MRPAPRSRWLALAIATTVLFAVWAVLSKPASEKLGSAQTQALSTLGVLPVILALAATKGVRQGRKGLAGAAWAAAAGFLVGAGNVAYFRAYEAGGEAVQVVPFTALYPLVTVVLALVFLRERPSLFQCAGLALAGVAIAIFIQKEGGELRASWWRYALVPLFLWGAGAYFQKISAMGTSSELSTLAFLAAFAPLSAALLAISPPSATPSTEGWVLVILVGATFALGNLTLIAAYASGGKASVVTPLAGLYPAVAIPLAVLFLGETTQVPDRAAIALSLAAAACLSIEKKKGPIE